MSLIATIEALLSHYEQDVGPVASVMAPIARSVWDDFIEKSVEDTPVGEHARDVIASTAQVVPDGQHVSVQFAAGDWSRLQRVLQAASVGIVGDHESGAPIVEMPVPSHPPVADQPPTNPPAPIATHDPVMRDAAPAVAAAPAEDSASSALV